MVAKTWRWTEARKAEVLEAISGATTRAEAAAALKVSTASLDYACRIYGFETGALLSPAGTTPAPFRADVEPEPGEAPWQGYRPRGPTTAPPPTPRATASKGAVTRTVVLADLHVPYQDPRAVGCAFGLVRDLKPDRVVVNGDLLDLESLSRHPKARPDLAKLASELYAANLLLDSLQAAAGSAEVVLLEGNHEARARRFECEWGQLDGVLSIPVGLYIEPREEYRRPTDSLRGIRWVPLRAQPFALGGVSYLHGVFESIHHAYAHAWQLGPRCTTHAIVTAHMHSWQSSSSSSGHTAYACPWLGDPGAPVFAYTRGRPRPWSHGVLVVEEAGDAVSVSLVPIVGGRAIHGGRVVQSP